MAQQILMQGQAPPLMKKKSSLRLRRKSLGETPGFYHGIKYDLIEQEPQQAAALRQDFAPPVVAPGAMPFGQAGFAPAGFEQRERGGVFRKVFGGRSRKQDELDRSLFAAQMAAQNASAAASRADLSAMRGNRISAEALRDMEDNREMMRDWQEDAEELGILNQLYKRRLARSRGSSPGPQYLQQNNYIYNGGGGEGGYNLAMGGRAWELEELDDDDLYDTDYDDWMLRQRQLMLGQWPQPWPGAVREIEYETEDERGRVHRQRQRHRSRSRSRHHTHRHEHWHGKRVH